MSLTNFYDLYKLDDSILNSIGFNPYYQKTEMVRDDKYFIDKKPFIDLASNNYLGIANCDRIKKAYHTAIDKFGASLCATPIAMGYSDLYEAARTKLSKFIGLDDCIIYPTCYQANNGLFSVITKKNDVVIIDQYAHSSLVEGVKATGCKIRPFLHNSLDNLEKNLKNSQNYNQRFVVTESVFSTEGTIAPLKQIEELCHTYHAIPVVDDSHGIGTIGKSGRGILEQANCYEYQGIYTTSLGKAVGNLGGVVAGKKSLIEYLSYYSSHLVYSTALPPHVLAGISEALTIIEEEFEDLQNRLWHVRAELVVTIKQNRFFVSDAKAPIISIEIGNEEKTLMLAKHLYENNIVGTPFIFPSVPKNKGVVRLIPGANISDESIKHIKKVFSELDYDNYC